MSRLVVIGAGDLGGRVAAYWVDHGLGEAIGITRSTDRHEALAAAGVTPTTAGPSEVLRADDLVLLSVGGSTGLRAVAETLPRLSARAVMTSSTGFYGWRSGRLGPDTPPGEGDRAQAAAAAEQAFRDKARDGVVIRLGGLYRSGRGPQEALRRRGRAPTGPAERPLPLIHVHDAVTAVVRALRHPDPAATYVGVVNPIPTRQAFYALACARLALPPPRFEGERLDRSFDADRFRADLLPEPAWPRWQTGVAKALD